MPPRELTPGEARQILERQAARLLRLSDTVGPPVPIDIIAAGIPPVIVKYAPNLPSSGRAQWTGTAWVLVVDSAEPKVRQRYSLAHELAHVVWHPLSDHALPNTQH